MTTLKKILFSLLGISMVTGLLVAAPLVTPQGGDRSYVPKIESMLQPAVAAASGYNHRRFVVYSGSGGPGGYSLRVRLCHNWYNGSVSFSTSGLVCGAHADLYRDGYPKYSYSDLGWHDTDGLYVAAGRNVYTSIIINNAPDTPWNAFRKTGWHKRSGCNWCLTKIKVVYEWQD